MVNLRLVKRIADIYFVKYREEGAKSAEQYAERLIGADQELQDKVRVEVEKHIHRLLTGGTPNDDTDSSK